jgi:anti-sigma B factor antagonist
MFVINVNRDAIGRVICRPVGELDLYSVCQFRQALADIDPSSRVVIDISGVSFVDSAGISALVGGIRRIRDRGSEVVLASPRPTLRRLLRTIGVDRIVTITENVQPATPAA